MKNRSFEDISDALNPSENPSLNKPDKSFKPQILCSAFFVAAFVNLMGHGMYADKMNVSDAPNAKQLKDHYLAQGMLVSGGLVLASAAFGLVAYRRGKQHSEETLGSIERYLGGLDFRHKKKAEIEIIHGDKPPSLDK